MLPNTLTTYRCNTGSDINDVRSSVKIITALDSSHDTGNKAFG